MLMRDLNNSLRDVDEADAESVYRLAGYLMRKTASGVTAQDAGSGIKIINGKAYRKTSADRANWLR
jgi:hypothetical protein